jgi:2-polyprenyl-3-methyl-5-hydroxy-6-metoxy-1,4-benzoquinol methylase
MNVRVLAPPLLGGFRTAVIPPDQWEEVGRCQICGGAEALRDVALVVDGARAGELAACTVCEFVFFRRRPVASWFDAFYAREWDFGRREHMSAQAPVAAVSRVLDFCRPHVPAGARVFEIGAGLGGSLRAFAEAGFRVAAVEPSRHRAQFVREVMQLPCVNEPIEALSAGETFDLVYVNHVLEHVFDPARAVERAAAMLQPGGYLYIAVPNLWNECAAQVMHYLPHLSIFTERALRRLLMRQGFEVVRAELVNDIQVLARKSGGPEQAWSDGSAEFWRRLSDLLVNGFGGSPGRHHLLWFPSGDHAYRRFRASKARASALRLGSHLTSSVPRRWSRFAPAAWRARLRAVDVELSGELALPVRVTHATAGHGAWIK